MGERYAAQSSARGIVQRGRGTVESDDIVIVAVSLGPEGEAGLPVSPPHSPQLLPSPTREVGTTMPALETI